MHSKRVLIVHSVYRHKGGEERLVELEETALKELGFEVRVLTRDGSEIRTAKNTRSQDLLKKTKLASEIFIKGEAARSLAKTIDEFDPFVVHFHNIMPHWGYAAVKDTLNWALRKGRKVFTTIHNQRWICANGLFFRDGQHCQLCFDRQNPLWGGVYDCRNNRAESLTYSVAISYAWAARIYNHPSHHLLALNPRTAERLKRAFPCSSIITVPNPVEINIQAGAPLTIPGEWRGNRIAVIGRLSAEKGITRALHEIRWGNSTSSTMADPTSQIVFAGDGPLRPEIEEEASKNPRVLYLGRLPESDIPRLLKAVDGLFHGSVVEEQSPTVLRMAAAMKLPVYSWGGRLKSSELMAWGELHSTQSWAQQIAKIFN